MTLPSFRQLFAVLINCARLFVRRRPGLKRALMPVAHRAMTLFRYRHVVLSDAAYGRWIMKFDTLNATDVLAIQEHMAALPERPLLSVIMTVYETPERFLREAITSIQTQLYEHWELCIVDDASPSPHVGRVLAELAEANPRIRYVRRPIRGHICAASNTALTLAQGSWVVLVDHDDILPPNALYELAAEIAEHPDAAVIYSDEDQINGAGVRRNPYFKPDFDPDLLLGQNFISHLSAYRRDLVNRVGGFREGFEGSQDHDLALRTTAVCGSGSVRHIPRILYHWRQNAGPASFSETALARCIDASRRAVAEHLAARGYAVKITSAPLAETFNRVVFPIPDPAPLVSVIIPTRDHASMLRDCIGGLLQRTNYPAIEVLIADNDSCEPETAALFAELAQDSRVSILSMPGPFNYAQLNNRAAVEARGEILLLLNNDIDVIDPDWLVEIVSHAIRPEIGAVGCKLLYPNGLLQHGGTVLGIGKVADHLMTGARGTSPGLLGNLALLRSNSAVTAACLALRREVWNAVGGMDQENLPVAFNDVDLCLRIRAQGLRIVWTPFAKLYHRESISRGREIRGEKLARFQREEDYMQARWGQILLTDPYYSPNYTLDDAQCNIASPPRCAKRWAKS
jgi:O-antigen biosynthesis protein